MVSVAIATQPKPLPQYKADIIFEIHYTKISQQTHSLSTYFYSNYYDLTSIKKSTCKFSYVNSTLASLPYAPSPLDVLSLIHI